jgi:hypothetical protein
MRWLALILAFVAPLSMGNALESNRIQIVCVNVPRFLSGYLSTWTVIVAIRGTSVINLYRHHEMRNEALPKEGDVCVVEYHVGNVAGLVGPGNVNMTEQMIVDQLSCSSK